MRADVKQKLVVPAHFVSAHLRPDVVLWSSLVKVIYFVELMCFKPMSLTLTKYSQMLEEATQ